MSDIILLNEDYTIGKILEYVLYTKFFATRDPVLNFGFWFFDRFSMLLFLFSFSSALMQRTRSTESD